MKILTQNLTIKAVSNETIARADDVFSWIHSDFENYGTDKKSPKTEKTKVAVLDQEKDGTFKGIFTSISSDLDSLCLTQAQIIEFVKTHKAELNQNWYNFFLFKVGEEFFVAGVFVRSDGFRASALRFSLDLVWDADFRPRVVVPQLALGKSVPTDILIPCAFVPCPNCGIELEIIKVKK